MAGGEGRSCSRNSFVVDGFPDGCGGSGGVQELAKAGRAEALGGSCGEYDAPEMGQADAREGRPRHDDDRDGGLSGMTETVETTDNADRKSTRLNSRPSCANPLPYSPFTKKTTK